MQRRIQEFLGRGRGMILGVSGLFWCTLTHTICICKCFVVKVENEIHIMHIACWLQLKNMRLLQFKIIKTKLNYFQTGVGGGGARARFAGPVSAFEMLIVGKGNLRNPWTLILMNNDDLAVFKPGVRHSGMLADKANLCTSGFMNFISWTYKYK